METATMELEQLMEALGDAQNAVEAQTVSEMTADALLFARLKLGLQDEALRREKIFKPILDAGKRGRGARIAVAAEQLGLSVVNTRVLFDRYREQGLLGLVNWKKAGTKNQHVPRACVEWMKGLAEINGGNLRRAFEQGTAIWKSRTPWQNVKGIPGYHGYPPATTTGLPAGWSYTNFHRLCGLSKFDRKVAGQGLSAALSFTPLLNRTRKELHCGQVLMFDDVWHDINTTMYGTNSELIRPIELCCLDVFSAKKIIHILKPRKRNEETGQWENFRDIHMRYLLAAVLTRVGVHPDGCQLIVEHGTAQISKKKNAIGEDLETVLHKISDGKITVVRGAIQDTPAVLGAWGGPKKGNFRVKSALESMHNIPHLWERHLIGATGSNSRTNLPDEHHGREAEHTRITKAITEAIEAGTKPEIIGDFLQALKTPFLPFAAYVEIVNQLYDIIDRRTLHNLEGWKAAGLFTGEFRLRLDSPDWLPDAMFEKLADSEHYGTLEALILANKGHHRMRPLSPHEVWQRGAKRLMRYPDIIIPQVLGADLARPARVTDSGEFLVKDAELLEGELSYIARPRDPFGYEITLRDRVEYAVFINPFDLDNLIVCEPSASGPRYIGVCPRKVAVSHADMDAVHHAMGVVAHAQTERMRPYRQRHAPDAADTAATKAQNTAAIQKLLGKNPHAIKPSAELEAERAMAATDTEDVLDALRKRATELSTK
jgi:hypothetical protein